MSLALEQVLEAVNEILEENGYDYQHYELLEDGVHLYYKEFVGNGKWKDAEALVGSGIKDVIESICGFYYTDGIQNG